MSYLIYLVDEFLYFFNEIAIYLVFGFVVAAILYVLFPTAVVKQHLGNDNFTSVIKSSLFGIPLPLCSCGVVPVATALKRNGASDGATVSFLISTPQVGADSFLITYSLLGWIFALFRIIASTITAMFAGFITNLFRKKRTPPGALDSNDAANTDIKSRANNMFSYIEFELLGSIANSLLLGMGIAAVIAVVVPNGFFVKYLNSNLLSMLLMMVVGIPMYVCASASTPIAASLILKGLSPGAGLVFLLTGPATNAVTISAVVNVLGKKAVSIYLFSIAVVALGLGYLLNIITLQYGFREIITTHQHDLLPGWVKLFGSVTLAFMLLLYYGRRVQQRYLSSSAQDRRTTTVLSVNDMTCQHCVHAVKTAAKSVQGVRHVRVNLDQKKVFLDAGSKDMIKKVKNNIRNAGYSV